MGNNYGYVSTLMAIEGKFDLFFDTYSVVDYNGVQTNHCPLFVKDPIRVIHDFYDESSLMRWVSENEIDMRRLHRAKFNTERSYYGNNIR